MVLDSLRTLVIWAVSLAVGWETFHGLEILGFGVLLVGAALYNGLHRPLLARLWADNFSATGCGGTEEHGFQHPFLQVSPPPRAGRVLPAGPAPSPSSLTGRGHVPG
uniref:Uncharacterized protein n=1 Tax=Buteo japonicus TaxID=224669 RepID=A0A8C0C132_9AVES